MSKNIKRLSFIALIIAAIILIYGFIDASSYRIGYDEGYKKVSRSVDVACMNGLVADNALCGAAEVALYENQNKDGSLYFAQVNTTLNSSVTTSTVTTSSNLSKRKKRRATISATVATPAPAPPTFPEGFSPFIWIAESTETFQHSSLVSTSTSTLVSTSISTSTLISTSTQANITAVLDRQKIIIAQCPKAKILLYMGNLPETEDTNETKGLASCPPAGIPDGLFSDGGSVQDAAGGKYAVKKTGTNSLGLVMIAPPPPPPPPPPSPEEVLKAKALGADCAAAEKNRDACLAMDPYCVMSVVKRDGSGTYVNANYTAGCTDSETKISRVSFNPSDPCSQSDIQARMPRARIITGTSGEKICSDNITYLYLKEDRSSGKLMPLGEKGSLSELLRSPGLKDFAQKAGAKAVSVPVAPTASTPTPSHMPGGSYHPPTSCPSPSIMLPSGYCGMATIYKPSTLAQLIDTIVGLFRRSE